VAKVFGLPPPRKLVKDIVTRVLGKIYGILGKLIFSYNLKWIGRERNGFIYKYNYDHVRLSSLELIAFEINEKKLQGNVAELGVFRGDFARHINIAFPNRKLYLFDTFEGFDERDVKIESKEGYSRAKKESFFNTNVDLVLKKMKYPEDCIIKKGYFPATANDVNDKFVFVSIDADLFEPIYQGLCFFYPKLEHGGYIFVHDYNYKIFKGTKTAVRKFATEFNISYFPLTDRYGSAIFIK
jgi:O-methyltransferase